MYICKSLLRHELNNVKFVVIICICLLAYENYGKLYLNGGTHRSLLPQATPPTDNSCAYSNRLQTLGKLFQLRFGLAVKVGAFIHDVCVSKLSFGKSSLKHPIATKFGSNR